MRGLIGSVSCGRDCGWSDGRVIGDVLGAVVRSPSPHRQAEMERRNRPKQHPAARFVTKMVPTGATLAGRRTGPSTGSVAGKGKRLPSFVGLVEGGPDHDTRRFVPFEGPTYLFREGETAREVRS